MTGLVTATIGFAIGIAWAGTRLARSEGNWQCLGNNPFESWISATFGAFGGFPILIAILALMLSARMALSRHLWTRQFSMKIGPAGMYAATLILAVGFGAQWCFTLHPRPGQDDVLRLAPRRYVRLVARVAAEPRQTSGSSWVMPASEITCLVPKVARKSGRVWVSWAISDVSTPKPCRIGDWIQVVGSLDPIGRPSNPGDFDFGAWAARQGMFSTLKASRIDLVSRRSGRWDLGSVAADVREMASGALTRGMPERQAALIGSLLFGAGSVPVSPALKRQFTDLGLAHILAASGMQCALLLRLVGAALKAVQAPRYPGLALRGAIAVFYAAVCSFEPSVARAATMAAVAMVAEAVGRRALGIVALWLSALVMLIIEPVVLFDLGFQFSFLATLALLGTGADLARVLEASLARVAPNQASTKIGKLMISIGVEGVTAPVAALLWCLPLQLAQFGQVSLWSLPANWLAELIVIPTTVVGFGLAAFLVAADPLLVVCPIAIPPIGAWILGPPLSLLEGAVEWLHHRPGAVVEVPLLPASSAALSLALLGAIGVIGTPGFQIRNFLSIRSSRGSVAIDEALTGLNQPVAPPPEGWRSAETLRCVLGVALGFELAMGFMSRPATGGQLRILFLDVGQGDAIALRSPQGNCALVDAGPQSDFPEQRRSRVRATLESIGCRKLELAVLTHPHADHANGLVHLLRTMHVGELWDAGQSESEASYRQVLAEALWQGVPLVVVQQGQKHFIDGVTWEILAPLRPFFEATRSDPNNNGIVIKLSHGPLRVLLPADLESAAENRLLASSRRALRADILKVGHHGSRHGTSRAFLAAVRPSRTVFCVGRRNGFGHPDLSVVGRCKRYGSVFRTDRDGSIQVIADMATWSASPWRQG